MLKGQAVLVHQTGFVSAGISFFQSLAKGGSEEDERWNHAAVMVNEHYCVGAGPGGAKLRPVSFFTDKHISHIPYTPTQAHKVAEFASRPALRGLLRPQMPHRQPCAGETHAGRCRSSTHANSSGYATQRR